MKKRIVLHEKLFEYTLRVSERARRMRLAVYCDGSFVVTAPVAMDMSLVERFIAQKSRWILDKIDYFKNTAANILPKSTRRDYLANKDAALSLAKERIERFNQIFCFTFNRINIKDQKTRWGSCSRRGNLNFNYKIVHLPERLADYIVVHELCHLKEFNHSQKFWNLVAKVMPDYLELRSELKRNKISYL
jgi:predicted metal-dependent hydrolase